MNKHTPESIERSDEPHHLEYAHDTGVPERGREDVRGKVYEERLAQVAMHVRGEVEKEQVSLLRLAT